MLVISQDNSTVVRIDNSTERLTDFTRGFEEGFIYCYFVLVRKGISIGDYIYKLRPDEILLDPVTIMLRESR